MENDFIFWRKFSMENFGNDDIKIRQSRVVGLGAENFTTRKFCIN